MKLNEIIRRPEVDSLIVKIPTRQVKRRKGEVKPKLVAEPKAS